MFLKSNLGNRKKWNRFLLYCLLSMILSLPIFFVISVGIAGAINTKNWTKLVLIFFDKNLIDTIQINLKKEILIIIICEIVKIMVLWILVFFGKDKQKNNFLATSKHDNFGNASFIVDEREPKESDYKVFSKLFTKDFTEPSYLVSSKVVNKKLHFFGASIHKMVHQIVLGGTGSGKSQKLIFPTLYLNASLSDQKKPSFVITDPKGEILEKSKNFLESRGYLVKALNFKNPLKSVGWNPLNNCYVFWTKAMNYEKTNMSKKQIKKKEDLTEYQEYICLDHGKQNCEICFALDPKKIFLDKKEKRIIIGKKKYDDYVLSVTKELESLAVQEINDLVQSLVSTKEGDDSTWPDGAKKLIKGVILAFLEIKKKNPNAFGIEQFNMPTIQRNIASRSELTLWFKKYGLQNPTSDAWAAAATVIDTGDKTQSSYFSTAGNALKMFEDASLQDILVRNDIDLFEVAVNPTVLFLIIPDDRKDKHPLASLFISQLYMASAYVANNNRLKFGKEELDRDLMFLLDEFGNMPAIPNFDSIVTVSRSRRMFFTLILQDYQQLDKFYKNTSNIIKSNSLLTIYLSSTDERTWEEISKRLGKYTVETKSVTGDSTKDKSMAKSLTSKALLEPTQIATLNDPQTSKNNSHSELAIVLINAMQPSIVKLTWNWRLEDFGIFNWGNKASIGLNPKPIIFANHWFDLAKYDTSIPKKKDFDDAQGVTKKVEHSFSKEGKRNSKSSNLKNFFNLANKQAQQDDLNRKRKEIKLDKNLSQTEKEEKLQELMVKFAEI